MNSFLLMTFIKFKAYFFWGLFVQEIKYNFCFICYSSWFSLSNKYLINEIENRTFLLLTNESHFIADAFV